MVKMEVMRSEKVDFKLQERQNPVLTLLLQAKF
jgi:hypothetical protein